MQRQQQSWVLYWGTSLAVLITSVSNAGVPAGSFTDVRRVLPEYGWRSSMGEPHISEDGLILYFNEKDRPGGSGNLDLWQATRATTDDVFGNVTNLGRDVNSGGHDGGPMVSDNGLRMYFWRDFNDLYMASRVSTDEQFANAIALSTINSSAIDLTPSVSPDELTIYFTSTRGGGSGEADLYQATRLATDVPFGDVTNLGRDVNSWAHEVSPSVSADGLTLFLSGNAVPPYQPGGKGESDIWVATRSTTDDLFGEPINLDDLGIGSNLNTSSKDLFPHISRDWPADGSKIYFSSDRPGGTGIYEATWERLPSPDFDFDGDVDNKDADLLTEEIVAGTHGALFDLSADGVVDDMDLRQWLEDAAHHNGFSEPYLHGDSNLDGTVDALDLNDLAINWRQSVAKWSGGDFVVDGSVNALDLNELAINWRDSIPTASSASAAVPEPSALLLTFVGLAIIVARRTR